MSLYNAYSTDKNAEVKGIILRYPGAGDAFVEIRVARAGGSNTKFDKAFQHKFGPYLKSINNMDPKLANRLLAEVYADAVVLGWENVTDRNGAVMEFNHENVVKLFTDLPDFFKEVQSQAGNMALFREITEEEREAISGN